jgi:LacI family transcriptional regulator
VTIKDVAERAGVSPATVSRCLNGKRIRPDLRERVLAAVKELDYQPNYVARSLVSDKSHLIGVVIPDISNPFFADIVRAIDDVASSHGYSTIICNTDWNLNKEKEALALLSSRQVDGIVVAPSEVSPHTSRLKLKKTPVVLMTRSSCDFDSVETDHFKGGYLVARHFLDLGHTCVACIGGVMPDEPKYQGFRAGLAEVCIGSDLIYVQDLGAHNFSQEAAYQKAVECMTQATRRPTAIFALNDMLAVSVVRAIEDLGLRIPEDVAVAGFDNTILASAMRPALTSVSQANYEIGRLSTEFVLSRIHSETDLPPRQLKLEPRLVVRQSTLQFKGSSELPLTPLG